MKRGFLAALQSSQIHINQKVYYIERATTCSSCSFFWEWSSIWGMIHTPRHNLHQRFPTQPYFVALFRVKVQYSLSVLGTAQPPLSSNVFSEMSSTVSFCPAPKPHAPLPPALCYIFTRKSTPSFQRSHVLRSRLVIADVKHIGAIGFLRRCISFFSRRLRLRSFIRWGFSVSSLRMTWICYAWSSTSSP